jgi:hypothetical protein
MSIINALGIGCSRQSHVRLGHRREGSVFGVRVLYTALAEFVVVAHFAYLAVMIFGGLAASRWPGVLPWHLAAVGWAFGAVTIRYDCPFTALEQQLRARGGHGRYSGSFLRHYVRGVLFPEWLTPYVVAAIVGLILAGWLRLAWTSSRRTPASGCR